MESFLVIVTFIPKKIRKIGIITGAIFGAIFFLVIGWTSQEWSLRIMSGVILPAFTLMHIPVVLWELNLLK